MKVILAAVNSKYIHSNLAVRYLKNYTKDLNYECILQEYSINDRVERIVQNIMKEKPDMVGFSCYIWNMEYVLRVSKLLKLIDKNITIFFGGPEVSYEEASYVEKDNCDYIIVGEGEETYNEFIECILNNRQIIDVKGLYFKDKGKVIYTGKRELMEMDKIVFPYDRDEDLKNKIVYYEASRGCPFNCKYCLSSTVHGVRFLNLERVKSELKYFIDNKVNLVKFVDRTFNCDHTFAYSIWKFLIEEEGETTFHFEISADLLTKDEIELLSEAPKNRFQFEVGVQSTNNQVLKNINRTANFEDIKEKVCELLKIKNIHQHLDLIIGLPEEDFSSFEKSFNDLYSIEPEQIQLGFLKLLKGSSMREEADKWGIVYSPFPPYEILKTNHLSYEELIKLKMVEEMVDRYYNSGNFNLSIKYLLSKFDKPFDLYYSLSQFYYLKGYFDRNISFVDYYRVLIYYNESILNSDSFVLKEIVKYEFLYHTKKKWIPDFVTKALDKEEEKVLKRRILEDDYVSNNRELNNIRLEKFYIDIISLIKEGNIYNKETYIMFDDRNGMIKDVTSLIYQ